MTNLENAELRIQGDGNVMIGIPQEELMIKTLWIDGNYLTTNLIGKSATIEVLHTKRSKYVLP